MYTFIWLLSYIKICYLYLNKSRLLGEHCKAYKFKSEVFTNYSCSIYPGTRVVLLWEHLLPTILAGLYPRPCFSCRLILLLIGAFSLRVFSSGSPCFFLNKLTFRIPITLRRTISWEMWNFCSLILVCFLVSFTG